MEATIQEFSDRAEELNELLAEVTDAEITEWIAMMDVIIKGEVTR